MKDLPNFREFTFGWLIFVFLIPTYLLIIFLFYTGLGDRPLTAGPFILVSVVMGLTALLFYGMTTEINGETISVSFGVGLIRKKIPLTRIMNAETVRSPWYYGWGIRLIPNGMMFNISGLEAIELRFNDSDRVFRIGSKQPALLKKEIEKRISRR